MAMTLQELMRLGLIGQDTLNPMFTQLFGLGGVGDGFSSQNTSAPAWAAEDSRVMGESGTPGAYLSGVGSGFSQDAIDKANGYSFDWTKTGPRGAGTLTVTDPTGGQAGQYQQQSDSTFWGGVLEAGALAAAGFGGVGLMGLGPLGGLLGGAGGAGAAAGGGGGAGAVGGGVIEAGMADAAANLAAYGATAGAPANVAATFAGLPTIGAGAAGAGLAGLGGGGLGGGGGGFATGSLADGLGAIEAGFGASPEFLAGTGGALGGADALATAGLGLGAGGGAAMPGAAAAASGLAGSSGALGGLGAVGSFLGKNSDLVGGLLGTGAQLIGANAAQNSAQSATDKSNELLRYMYDTTRADNMPALTARNNAITQAGSLLQNPQSITQDPGYQFGLNQGVRAFDSSGAAKGMRLSGAQAKGLTQYGQDYAGTKLNDSVNRLMAVASGGQAGASTIANSGANYANGAAGNLASLGNFNAAGNVAMGNTIGNAINQLTAYGSKNNWWGGS